MENADAMTRPRIRQAQETLMRAGILDGVKNTRVQDQRLDAARRRSGIIGETNLVTAGLALLAAQEDFGTWLAGQRGRLSDDFETGL
jgi:hypothetical protein